MADAAGGPPTVPGSRADSALQEQHRQQGRLLRHPRELPDAARDAVRRHRPPPDPVLRHPPGGLRRRPGRHRGQDGRGTGFQLSQRADFFEVEVGLETTLKRPIINTRDEPHADPEKYRRLHVIIGDANLSEVADLPQARHHRAGAGDDRGQRSSATTRPVARGPVADLRAVSHDPSLKQLVTLRRPEDDRGPAADGVPGAGPQVHRGQATAPTSTPRPRDVLDRWESVLNRLADDPMQLSRELDWVAKLELLEGYRTPRRPGLGRTPARSSSTCSTPTCGPTRGLYNRLVAQGRMTQLATEDADRRADRGAARGHPGLLPRPVPAPVRGIGRRRLLGLGDLRHPGPGVPAAGARPWSRCAAPRRTSATCCWTAAAPRPTWSPR